MTKFKSKKNNKNRQSQEITVNDFANATVCKNRLKKSHTNVIPLKDVENGSEIIDNWYNEESIIPLPYCGNQLGQKNVTNENLNECSGIDYPYDLWFLISNYIKPEDIGTFSCICKTSLAVILSSQFWMTLYKRYFKRGYLPEELQPEVCLRNFGLRTSVIKSLFLMYPPFMCRLKQENSKLIHPEILKGFKCVGISMNHEKSGKNWCYYFKFRSENPTPFYRFQKKDKILNIIELLNDIHANTEENNCILKIITKELLPVLPVVGKILKSVSLGLSKEFCYQKLQLIFGTTGNRNDDVIILDRVCKIIILNWWHPQYITDKNLPNLNKELNI